MGGCVGGGGDGASMMTDAIAGVDLSVIVIPSHVLGFAAPASEVANQFCMVAGVEEAMVAAAASASTKAPASRVIS